MINISQLSLQVVKLNTKRYPLNKKIASPEDIYDTFQEVLALENQAEEVFAMITLDTKNKITGVFEVSRGTVNASLVHPREVFKRALANNATSIVIAHNHPSGDTNPSNEDKMITSRLKEAGDIIGIKVLDHIIIGDHYMSFRESGLL